MAAANAILTHTGPDTQKLEGPAALSDASKKQAEHAKEMEEINHKSEKKVLIFGSDRSPRCHSVCLSVRPAQSALEHSFFSFLAQIFKQTSREDFRMNSG